jgi:hypothetical protein
MQAAEKTHNINAEKAVIDRNPLQARARPLSELRVNDRSLPNVWIRSSTGIVRQIRTPPEP